MSVGKKFCESRWAVRLPRSLGDQAVRLRNRQDISLLETDEAVWIQGTAETQPERIDVLTQEIESMLGALRFSVGDDDLLTLEGHRLPSALLPRGHWQAFDEAVEIKLPIANLPAKKIAPASIELRNQRNRYVDIDAGAQLMTCELSELVRFVESSAKVRFQHLKFVVDENATAVVAGIQLPGIDGRRYAIYEKVAIELGWSWFPQVSPKTLSKCFRVGADSTVVWFSDQSWASIDDESWLPMTRANLRTTQQKWEST